MKIANDAIIRSQQLLTQVTEMISDMQCHAEQLDRESEFPVADFASLRAVGALSAVVPERFGGLGFGTVITSLLFLGAIAAIVIYLSATDQGPDRPRVAA